MYQFLRDSIFIRRTADGACIPPDPDNTDYAAYLAWVADGNTPDPAPLPTQAEQITALTAALDQHIDSVARAKGYDSRLTASLRAGYTGPYQAEGIAFAQWMDACYSAAFSYMAEVQAGTQPLPESDAAMIALLPEMIWP